MSTMNKKRMIKLADYTKARSLCMCIAAVLALIIAPCQSTVAAAPPVVAVLDFVTLWDVPQFGEESAEALRAALIEKGKYTVVDRNIIEQVLIGEGLLSPGEINQAAALKVGGLLNANYIAIGSVSSGLGEPYTMKVMFLDVETGAVVFGKKLTAENKDGIPALCEQIARTLVQDGLLKKIKLAQG